MNRKSIAALAVAAVMTLGVGASSYAWFTSQATSINNVVQAGTLLIGGTNGSTTLKTFTLDNLYPGVEGSKTDNITVKNNGSINLQYSVSATYKGGIADLYNVAKVKVTNPSGAIVYNGNLNLLNKALANKTLAVGKSETLFFTVSLPDNANDQYQGKTAYVDFVFDASQLSPTRFDASTLGAWVNDRTAPKSWNIANDWVTYSTDTVAANTWYGWHGKKTTTENVLTNNWKVETEFELTDELVARNGVRTAMWLNVENELRETVDWSILQFKSDEVSGTKGWQYWNSNGAGSWVDVATDLPTAAGVYKLAIHYDNGNIIGYINGMQVFSYAAPESKLTSVKEIILNSYSYGETYEVKWKVPTVSYVAQ